ncbi:hypothetical protein ACHAXR_008366 [Thalassiosira sp. AJA248-18]
MMKTMKTPFTILSLAASSTAFSPAPLNGQYSSSSSSTRLHFFEGLDKAFEDAGPLGKGITVGKVQVGLAVSGAERTESDSIFAMLEKHARNNDDIGSSYDADYEDGYGDSELSKMCHETCLALLRKSDNWVSACSDSEWFKEQDMGKAESLYNLWADREACKFEKEYIPPEGSAPVEGNPTVAVVSLVIEIQGDETNFDRAGFSLADTKNVLTSIASDCRVEGGDCLNAVEVFWTPSEPTEVLSERDTIIDFPELITL